jgi:hypothetical protein
MIVHQIAEKLTAADTCDSSAKEYNASGEWERGSGFSNPTNKLNSEAGLNPGKRNNSHSDSEELELYVQMRDKVLQEIIEHGLTTAQSKIFFYFYSLDRFGDRPIRAKVAEILRATKISRSVYYTAITKFKSMGWFRSPHPDVGISNFCTPKRKSRKQDWQSRKQDWQSEKQDWQSRKQDCQSEKQDYEKLKPIPAAVFKTPQTDQTYSDLLITLSEETRESFKKFCSKKIQECSFKIGSREAWLKKHGAEYLEEFKETYSYALANPELIRPKTPFPTPDIPSLKLMYKDGWKDAAIHYGLIDPNSPEEEIQNDPNSPEEEIQDESEPVAPSEEITKPIMDCPTEEIQKESESAASSEEIAKPIIDSDNPQKPTRPTPAIGKRHRKCVEGEIVIISEVGNIHRGETGKIILANYGSTEDEYTIALERESHSMREVTIKVPKRCKFPYLM